MMKKQQDPLRISQESLDLDDIISDLNSESHSMTNQGQTQQQVPQMNNFISQSLVKTAAPIKEIKPNPLQAQGKAIKPQVKETSKAKVNKENDPGLLNKQQPQHEVKTKYGLGSESAKETNLTVMDTKAGTSGCGFSEQASGGNQRYSDSTLKSERQSEHLDHDEPRLNSVPFYLKGAQQLSQDEDVEAFQRKLDTMMVNFRSETISEFMKTKKQVLSDQAQTIDAERRRCNTLLGVKQSEIEQLKEGLGSKSKLCEDLNIRCEGMSFWAGKAKMILRIKLLQHQAFYALRKYRDFKKHSKRVLEHKMRQYREKVKREVFKSWGRQYKQWKIVKNREDFDKAVKLELQHICSQYNKEIESLRERLNEAQAIVDNEQRHKTMMQENLKKAFMRGVCALNFEAMNILNPSDQNYQKQIEREMEKQVISAMNSVAQQSPFTYDTQSQQRVNIPVRPPIFQTASDHQLSPASSFEQEGAYQERKMMQCDSAQVNPFSQNMSEGSSSSIESYTKIDSKDSMWKPAPIMGREINQHILPSFSYAQPSITSQLKSQQEVVLSQTFNKLAGNQQTVTHQSFQADSVHIIHKNSNPQYHRLEEDTERRVIPGNPGTIVQGSSSLPDFVSGGQNAHGGEGRIINAAAPQSSGKTQAKANGLSQTTKRPTTTQAPSSALSKKK